MTAHPRLMADEEFAELLAARPDEAEIDVPVPDPGDWPALCVEAGDDYDPDLPRQAAGPRLITPPRLLWLADVARAAGLLVSEVAGWKERGGLYDANGQPLRPKFVLVHSTAEARNGSEAGGLGGVVHGTRTAPPPVSQVYVGRTGRAYPVASGVANHAGRGNARKAGFPGLGGNALLLGLEHANDNRGEPWSPAMYNASIRLCAAYLRRIGQPASHALAHREFSTSGKSDPVGIDMDRYRRDVAALLAKKEDPDMGSPEDAADAVWDAELISPSNPGKKHKAHEIVFNAVAAAASSKEAVKLLKGIDDKLDRLLGEQGTQ